MLDRSQCVLPVDEPGHNDEMHEMAREGFRCKLHLRRRVAYIEVPKCASTTVSNLLRARGAVEVLVGHPLYALCHELRVNETAPGWFRFTFVRDPLHRLFSTYYDITPPSPTALVAERERADASRFLATLRRFHDGTDVPNYHYYHQLAFLSAPTRGGDACRSRNGGAGAAWRARCPLKLVRFDFVGHVETIGEDWPVVERRLREPGGPRRLRARARDGAASRDTSPEANATTRGAVPHLRAHGDDKPAASFVNQTAVAAVVCSYLRTDYACLATECARARTPLFWRCRRRRFCLSHPVRPARTLTGTRHPISANTAAARTEVRRRLPPRSRRCLPKRIARDGGGRDAPTLARRSRARTRYPAAYRGSRRSRRLDERPPPSLPSSGESLGQPRGPPPPGPGVCLPPSRCARRCAGGGPDRPTAGGRSKGRSHRC